MQQAANEQAAHADGLEPATQTTAFGALQPESQPQPQPQRPLSVVATESVLIDHGPRYTRGLRDALELLGARRLSLPTQAGFTAPPGRRLDAGEQMISPSRMHWTDATESATGSRALWSGVPQGPALAGVHVGNNTRPLVREGAPRLGLVFDPEDPCIQRDMLRMIRQYLEDHGYVLSSMVVNDEANLMEREARSQQWQARRIRSAILTGDWSEVERLCQKTPLKNLKVFLYALYRQQFLELIERHETEKAYAVLMKRLKPLEGHAPRGPAEFRDLCYLLTCKSVHEAHAASIPLSLDWGGSQAGRELLAEQLTRLLDMEQEAECVFGDPQGTSPQRREVPPHRLEQLVQQAYAYQIEFARYHPLVLPRIRTLLEDYHCFAIPNAERPPRLCGHEANIKCVTFVGKEGLMLATGSSDRRVGLWDTDSGALLGMLSGHSSRVWDVSASPSGRVLASGSADGRIGLWVSEAHAPGFRLGAMLAHHPAVGHGSVATSAAMQGSSISSIGSIGNSTSVRPGGGLSGAGPGHALTKLPTTGGDVYTVCVHPAETHVLSGGYDKTLRLHDIRTGQIVRSFVGHQAAVTRAVFNPHGNLIVSGSKDSTIKFWDIISGVCVRTFSFHFGEVTSVELNSTGTLLLSSSKDNSNRLWDLRASRPIRRFKGHQNTSKNFIRACFGPNELLVIGGSEDGQICIWDVESATLIQRLTACRRGPVFSAVWSQQQSLLASCGNDGDARLWWYDPSRPLSVPDGAAA
jgi:COMPASS component SWD3